MTRWQRGGIPRDNKRWRCRRAGAPTVTFVVGLLNAPARRPIIVGLRREENQLAAATIRTEPARPVRA